jgi:hypothetical protein
MSCYICTEPYNRKQRTLIKCMYCDFEACRTCCTRYILDIGTPTCMNNACTKEWTRKFIVQHFTISFVTNDYKRLREKMLEDKEKSLMPQTQAAIEAEKEAQRVFESYKPLIHAEREKIQELNAQIRVLEQQKSKIRETITDITLRRDHECGYTRTQRLPKTFVRACPAEDCRGFLSSHWKCGLCDIHVCSQCHIILGPERNVEHVCKEDDLATAKLLDSDTKPCPKCATGIFKIEGCDQMWCTLCHTAFSWRTGRIETRIHNPHFYEWQRRQNNGEAPRVDGDNMICGQELNHNYIRDLLSISLDKSRDDDEILELQMEVRSILHVQGHEMYRFQTDHVENNEYLRRNYLRNEITHEQFVQEIQKRNKKFEKHGEIYDVLRLYTLTSTEILLRLLYETALNSKDHKHTQIQPYLQEIYSLKEYVHECLHDIRRTYNCTVTIHL